MGLKEQGEGHMSGGGVWNQWVGLWLQRGGGQRHWGWGLGVALSFKKGVAQGAGPLG